MNVAKHGNQKKKKQIWLKLSGAKIASIKTPNGLMMALDVLFVEKAMVGNQMNGSALTARGGEVG